MTQTDTNSDFIVSISYSDLAMCRYYMWAPNTASSATTYRTDAPTHDIY